MPAATPPEQSHVSDQDMEQAMRQYGITRIPTQSFEYGGYRYTNIKDAVAAARRQGRGEESGS